MPYRGIILFCLDQEDFLISFCRAAANDFGFVELLHLLEEYMNLYRLVFCHLFDRPCDHSSSSQSLVGRGSLDLDLDRDLAPAVDTGPLLSGPRVDSSRLRQNTRHSDDHRDLEAVADLFAEAHGADCAFC